ncbi:MAG: hypothetical protein U0176_05020 [Bacteroidia bacterium]
MGCLTYETFFSDGSPGLLNGLCIVLAGRVIPLGNSLEANEKLYALLEPGSYDATKQKLTGAKVAIQVDRSGSANNM